MSDVHTLNRNPNSPVSDSAQVAPTILQRHVASCSLCNQRWSRMEMLEEYEHDVDHQSPKRSASGRRRNGSLIAYASTPSPIGTLWLAVGATGLLAVEFHSDELTFVSMLERQGTPVYDREAVREVSDQLASYFVGERREFDFPIDLRGVSPFSRHVLRAVSEVPYGTVQSYRDIACAVGKPGAARAVGGAVATNPITVVVPCHRIIRSDGTPGEYGLRSLGACGVPYKLTLLAGEGVTFTEKR